MREIHHELVPLAEHDRNLDDPTEQAEDPAGIVVLHEQLAIGRNRFQRTAVKQLQHQLPVDLVLCERAGRSGSIL